MKKYQCPCCGYFTYNVPANEDCGYICPVCFWENDPFIASDNEPSDSNHGITLKEAKSNFSKFGACVYNKDNSYTEYAGQAVIFTLSLADGSQVEIIAYNPFIIIDGIGYKCKYEPCEALNHYANELMTREP